MRRDASFHAPAALVVALAGFWLLGLAPTSTPGPIQIDVGPLAGNLTLPPGWVAAGEGLAAKLLKRDGVDEPPVLSFLKGQNQVAYATTKVVDMSMTAAQIAGSGPDLAGALDLASSAVQCTSFPHPSGAFEVSICETVATSPKLALSGKVKTAAIWVDIPITYEGISPGVVINSWTSLYFRGPGAAKASGHEVVEALLDALALKPGLHVVAPTAAKAAAEREGASAKPSTLPPPPAATPPVAKIAGDGRQLADLFAQGLTNKPTSADVTALRGVADAYAGTVLGEVAAQLAGHAAGQIALSTWKELLAKAPGDAQLRSLALRFFGAALRAGDVEMTTATAKWLTDHQVHLADCQPEDLALVFSVGDLCVYSGHQVPAAALDLSALASAKSDSDRRVVDLFRSRGLVVPDVSTFAVMSGNATWKPKGDRTEALPPVLLADGRLGSLVPKDPARLKAGYEWKPYATLFDALGELCRAKR